MKIKILRYLKLSLLTFKIFSMNDSTIDDIIKYTSAGWVLTCNDRETPPVILDANYLRLLRLQIRRYKTNKMDSRDKKEQ